MRCFILLAVMVLIPDLAFAEDSMPTKLIHMIGPDMMSGHIPNTAIGAAMTVFLSMLEAYGSFVMCSHVVIGMISTAHEGKVLGSRWHQVWAPIRVVTGVGSLVPVAGGFCMAQLLLIQGAVLSSDAASAIWTKYVETVALGGTTSNTAVQPIGLPSPLGGIELLHQVLKLEVCQKIYATNVQYENNGFLAWLPGMPQGSMVPTLPPAAGTSMGQSVLWQYGTQCGAIEIRATDTSKTVRSAQIFSPTPGMIQFMSDQQASIGKVIEGLRDSNIPNQIALSQQPGSGQTFPEHLIAPLKGIAQQYEAEMLAASQRFLVDYDKSLRSKMVTASTTDGWMAAGAYFPAVSQMSQQMGSLAGSKPEFTQPDVADHIWNSSLTRQIAKTLELTEARWQADSKIVTMTGAELAQFADERSNFITGQLSKILNPITEYLIHSSDGDMTRELESRIEFGQRLLVTAEVLAAARLAVAWAAGNGAGQLSGAWAVYQQTTTLSDLVLVSLLVSGGINAYLLPMQPQTSLIFGIVGWLAFLAESLVGIALLAVLMVKMDGQEFIDSAQRPGMMMILNVGLRAPLIIFGMIFGAYTLLPMSLYIVDWLFPMGWVSVQGGGLQFIVGVLVSIYVKTLLNYQCVIRCCCLSYELPNRCISWLGQSETGRSEGSNVKEMGGNAQSGTQTGVSKLVSTSTSVEKGLSASKFRNMPTP